MKRQYRKQAEQLYVALKAKNQTWTRNRDTLHCWARCFESLERDAEVSPKRIQRILNWYTTVGIGALYCPLVNTGESFCARFEDVADARVNLKTQTIHYYDDLIDYKFRKLKGSRIQQEYQFVTQRIEQQIQLVDDLTHGRKKLSKLLKAKRAKPVAKRGAKDQKRLGRLLIVNRELLYQLILERPGAKQELTVHMDKLFARKSFQRTMRRALRLKAAEVCPF